MFKIKLANLKKKKPVITFPSSLLECVLHQIMSLQEYYISIEIDVAHCVLWASSIWSKSVQLIESNFLEFIDSVTFYR